MLGDSVQDILAVKDALAERRRDAPVELLAWGEPCLAALARRLGMPGKIRTQPAILT